MVVLDRERNMRLLTYQFILLDRIAAVAHALCSLWSLQLPGQLRERCFSCHCIPVELNLNEV